MDGLSVAETTTKLAVKTIVRFHIGNGHELTTRVDWISAAPEELAIIGARRLAVNRKEAKVLTSLPRLNFPEQGVCMLRAGIVSN